MRKTIDIMFTEDQLIPSRTKLIQDKITPLLKEWYLVQSTVFYGAKPDKPVRFNLRKIELKEAIKVTLIFDNGINEKTSI